MISFTVHGQPATAGSKRGFYNAKARRVIITDDSEKSRPWKALVADAAVAAMPGPELLTGPLEVVFDFYVPRPKGHYGARGVKPSAPAFPAVKPDVLKLARAVEDALTGIVWRDDAQIVMETITKRYGEPARVEILVTQIGSPLDTPLKDVPAEDVYLTIRDAEAGL